MTLSQLHMHLDNMLADQPHYRNFGVYVMVNGQNEPVTSVQVDTLGPSPKDPSVLILMLNGATSA